MIALLLISAGLAYFFSLPFASVLQGGNYRIRTYFTRAKKDILLCFVWCLCCTGGGIAAVLCCGRILLTACIFLIYWSMGVFTWFIHRVMKMPVTFTNRLVRLLVVNTFLYGLLIFGLYFTSFYALWAAFPALIPVCLPLGALIMNPIEKKNNERYLARAKEKLSHSKGIKIGITGSYGKTSIKTDLDRLLSLSYKTLVTPANYNTPLGIAKTMEVSDGREEILILEMGARRKGDIRELCELVSPTIGVLTGIAPQHLETFKSEEAILWEKGELGRFVPAEGIVFYNLTDSKVRRLYEERQGRKIGVGFEDAEYLIGDLEMSAAGSSFRISRGGEEVLSLDIPIVGKAGVVNCALAAVVALTIGLSREAIEQGAKTLYPAPHRFEVTKVGEFTVIDDSYNINPIGAVSALESLAYFEGDRRVVYASGIVELGEKEADINRELGRKLAANADLAILAEGRYGDYVAEGISEYDPNFRIIRVKDTAEASLLFKKILRKGDVLLIMSDLPRDYLL